MDSIRINDGSGLYDEVGLCDALLKIADNVEVKGSANIQNMLLIMSGLEKIRQRLQKIRDEKEESMKEEVSANGDSHPVNGENIQC